MSIKNFNSQKGVSLIEVLFVLVIISILLVISVAQFGNADARFQTQNIARELKVNFERARFDSVKRRASNLNQMSKVVINNATSFSLTIDANQSGLLETADTKTINFANRSDVKIIAQGMSLPVTIFFDRKGHTRAVDSTGAIVTPTFIICDNCTASTITNENSFLVSVSPTGTITMLKNGETLPNHTDPTTTDVNANFEIDTMVTVQNGLIPNGTPVPTPTPDPTPNPTATPTPTPTPTPTATPTPTPTPRVCYSHEYPSQSGCVCNSPMYIHTNGQCK